MFNAISGKGGRGGGKGGRGGGKKNQSRAEFLKEQKEIRQKREQQRLQSQNVTKIQSFFRSKLALLSWKRQHTSSYDSRFGDVSKLEKSLGVKYPLILDKAYTAFTVQIFQFCNIKFPFNDKSRLLKYIHGLLKIYKVRSVLGEKSVFFQDLLSKDRETQLRFVLRWTKLTSMALALLLRDPAGRIKGTFEPLTEENLKILYDFLSITAGWTSSDSEDLDIFGQAFSRLMIPFITLSKRFYIADYLELYLKTRDSRPSEGNQILHSLFLNQYRIIVQNQTKAETIGYFRTIFSKDFVTDFLDIVPKTDETFSISLQYYKDMRLKDDDIFEVKNLIDNFTYILTICTELIEKSTGNSALVIPILLRYAEFFKQTTYQAKVLLSKHDHDKDYIDDSDEDEKDENLFGNDDDIVMSNQNDPMMLSEEGVGSGKINPQHEEEKIDTSSTSDLGKTNNPSQFKVLTSRERNKAIKVLHEFPISTLGNSRLIQALLRDLKSIGDPSEIGDTYRDGSITFGQMTDALMHYIEFAKLFIDILQLAEEDQHDEILSTLAFNSSILKELHGCLKCVRYDAATMLQYHDGLYAPVIALFCYLYSHVLTIIGEDEFYSPETAVQSSEKRSYELFALSETKEIAHVLNRLLYKLHSGQVSLNRKNVDNRFMRVVERLMSELISRDSRRQFTDPGFWIIPEASQNLAQLTAGNKVLGKFSGLIERIPHVYPFEDRIRVFNAQVEDEKVAIGYDEYVFDDMDPIDIRREFIVEDAIAKMSHMRTDLKNHIQIRFLDSYGNAEDGIDGGGLFKEFISLFLTEVFHPNFGLFTETAENTLIPNPYPIHPNSTQLYELVGTLLGKALFEGVLIEPKFARAFLNQILRKKNQINDLQSIDSELYRNLLKLKETPKVEELGFTFSTSENRYGVIEDIPLRPGGEQIGVTDDNKYDYIHAMADFKLNTQMKSQSRSFRRGMSYVIPYDWLRIFNQDELQVMISGASDIFDVEDLRAHTLYSGGYNNDDPTVRIFWNTVTQMSNDEKKKFLEFITGCSRPPALGFGSLNPKFTIQRIQPMEGYYDFKELNDRLPTSSTCANLLRLPEYSTKEQLIEKLLYAIISNVGFHLT